MYIITVLNAQCSECVKKQNMLYCYTINTFIVQMLFCHVLFFFFFFRSFIISTCSVQLAAKATFKFFVKFKISSNIYILFKLVKTFIFVTDNSTGWEPLVKTCQWPNIPVPSIPKCDGPNNKNKQRGVELLPQSEHLNENHMELPRHTVSGNPIPLRLFLPFPTLLQSLHCFSVSHSSVHLWIYRTKLQPIVFLKLSRVKKFSYPSLICRDNC